MRIVPAVVALVVVLGCASSRTREMQQVTPEDIAGTWTYEFSDGQRFGGTIVIPNDTSPDAVAEISSDAWPGMSKYPGALRALMHTGRFVCWTHSMLQRSGIELTVHAGRLHATYFDNCTRLIRNPQRSVRDCRHTLLTVRRVGPP